MNDGPGLAKPLTAGRGGSVPPWLRRLIDVRAEEVPALAALSQRVKAALDPRGILNPGRLRAA